MKTYGEVEARLRAFLISTIYMEMSGQFRAPTALSLGNSFWYPLEKMLHGLQRWYRDGGKQKNPFPVGNRTPVVQPVALSLYWLSYPGSEPRWYVCKCRWELTGEDMPRGVQVWGRTLISVWSTELHSKLLWDYKAGHSLLYSLSHAKT
jgi:hypothetical protein